MTEPAPPSGPLTDRSREHRVIAGRTIILDDEGFLWEAGQWSEEVALALAQEGGLGSFTEAHWRVIRFFREFYAGNGRAPLNRQLKEGTGLSLRELEELFPGGIKNGARRIAGLPNPKSCV